MRGRRRPVMAQGVVNRFAVRGLGAIVPIHSALLGACEPWPLVMLRRGYTFLMTSGSCTDTPGMVEVWRRIGHPRGGVTARGVGNPRVQGGVVPGLNSGERQPRGLEQTPNRVGGPTKPEDCSLRR
jgi:hypothetical protein